MRLEQEFLRAFLEQHTGDNWTRVTRDAASGKSIKTHTSTIRDQRRALYF